MVLNVVIIWFRVMQWFPLQLSFLYWADEGVKPLIYVIVGCKRSKRVSSEYAFNDTLYSFYTNNFVRIHL